MMYSRALYTTGFVWLVAVCHAFSHSPINPRLMPIQEATIIDGASVYQQNFTQFQYYIESIGTVSIDAVSLESGTLTAIYSYQQGSEIRNVLSVLTVDSDGMYTGTCTTKVKGKVLFAVNTSLSFQEDGTAIGNWSWSGTPSSQDPIVNISKR